MMRVCSIRKIPTLHWYGAASWWVATVAIVFLALGLPSRTFAQSIQDDYGYAISPHPVSDIFFLDSSNGWMVVEVRSKNESFLLKTADGGKTWEQRNVQNGITRVKFASTRLGWALARSSLDGGNPTFYMLHTSDGGNTWTPSPPIKDASDSVMTDFAFINEQHGWVVGRGAYGSSLVLETFDAGKTFRKLNDLDKSFKACEGILTDGKQDVWIYGLGAVLHSSDNGKTWRESVDLGKLGTNSDAFDISSAYFSNTGKGWIAGQDPDAIILGTKDHGAHWNLDLRTKEVGNFRGMWFWDDEHGCAASVYPVLLFCTDDGGLMWKSRNVLPQATNNQAGFFNSLIIFSSGRGWALRGGGFLYETIDGGKSWHDLDIVRVLNLATHR